MVAAKKKKRCKKRKKCQSLEEICGPQVEDCIAILTAVCGGATDCDQFVGCCEALETCDVGAFIACLSVP